MSVDGSKQVEPPEYLSDNIAEFLKPPSPRIAAVTWRRWMEPYFRLEEHELGVRLTSQGEFQEAIILWLKQLDLQVRGIAGLHEFDGLSREEQQALNFRLNLLGLSISTTKLALDGLLGGHYSGSLALCRSLLETWRRVAYARLHPSDIWRWFPQEMWPPDVLPNPTGNMSTKRPDGKEIGQLIEILGDDSDKAILKRVRSGVDVLSDHAHPSIEGAMQTWTDDPELAVFSPQFSEVHARFCLRWGLFANQILLKEILAVKEQTHQWISEFEQVAADVHAWLWLENE